jgi:hypothetical protein
VESIVAHAADLELCGQTAAAWELVRGLLAAGSRTPSLVLLFGRLARYFDAAAEAFEIVSKAIGGPNADPTTRSTLHFCAAGLLDSLGRYDEAFFQATCAHQLRQAHYDPGRIERLVRDWTSYFTPATLKGLPRATHVSQLPVFIVGMPRSGSTLVEQILSSHPQVHGAGELDWVFGLWNSAVAGVSSPSGSLIECLDRLTQRDVEVLSAEYLKRLAALSPGVVRIVDKLPMNLLNLGLIAMLFPQSRVIYTRRDSLDTCLSCYLTDLAAGNEFAFSLSSTGHLYRHCERLMAHWRQVLEIPILEVVYERVVDDVEAESRRMIDFLELSWDPGCLRFYENPRPVATASSAQVRRPIYRGSVGRWRNYERHLAPLRVALGM